MGLSPSKTDCPHLIAAPPVRSVRNAIPQCLTAFALLLSVQAMPITRGLATATAPTVATRPTAMPMPVHLRKIFPAAMTRSSPSGEMTCFDKIEDRFISDCEAARIDNDAYDKAAKEEADQADKAAKEEADQVEKERLKAKKKQQVEGGIWGGLMGGAIFSLMIAGAVTNYQRRRQAERVEAAQRMAEMIELELAGSRV